MAFDYDILVIGGGPAGYAAAIRAAQLGKKSVCIEKDKLGGICLNWGCIPTKALLTNAHLVETIRTHGKNLAFTGHAEWDFGQMIKRSRDVTIRMNRGIEGLFKKYKVHSISGTAKVVAPQTVDVGGKRITAESILLATGTRPKPLPGAEYDGKTIISYKEAMVLPQRPESLIVIGAGAIGCEFGDFYHAIGTQVTIIEMLDHILPIEDEEVSVALERSFTKRGMKLFTKSKTTRVEKNAKGVRVTVETPQGEQVLEAEKLLVAIGVTGNVEELFDPKLGVKVDRGHIVADRTKGYVTGAPGVYAIGDVNGPPWLAHVAHAEAICCVELLCGGKSHREVDYGNIPGCTYTSPGVASVGLTEKAAKEEGREIKVGRFPFLASGRAVAADETEGFAKLIFDAKYGELLGAHIIGAEATELIAELVLAKRLEATAEDIIHAIHPHPTFSEAVMEAAAQAYGESVHI
jgi:dihydrolipoamide dehydrogenase